jgi:protein phosphatase
VEKITQLLPKQFTLAEDRFHAYSSEILLELFTSIHQAMLELAKFDPNCIDMGATLTLAWFRRGRLYYGHIGDSRLYHLPVGSSMQQITEDHSYVGWLRRSGQINEREHRNHPRRNVLSQALGAGHRYMNPQMGFLEFSPGDRFLLCSDGVNDGLWDRALEDLASQPASTQGSTIASQIVMAAVAESGRDNATAVHISVS